MLYVPFQKEEVVFPQSSTKFARLYDILALLVVVVVVVLDQWTKWLVVTYLSPPDRGPDFAIINPYLLVDYIQNRGAAFGILANNVLLAVFIAIAVVVIGYLYVRMLNNGPLRYKIVFGMIIGGAIGNLIDRFHNGGFVVDFIFFQIPQINFQFAVFNIADASISVGVFFLFLFVLFGGRRRSIQTEQTNPTEPTPSGEVTGKK